MPVFRNPQAGRRCALGILGVVILRGGLNRNQSDSLGMLIAHFPAIARTADAKVS